MVFTSNDGDPLRILLADDHDMVRDGMRHYLERLSDHVEFLEAASLHEVLAFSNIDPVIRLVLLDLQMPGMRGVASVAEVCSAFKGVPVVVISGTADNATMTSAIGFGAAGFVPKNSSGKALVSALKLVLDGNIYVPPLMVHQSMEPSYRDHDKELKGPSGHTASIAGTIIKARKKILGPLAAEPLLSIMLELYHSQSTSLVADVTFISAQLQLPLSTLSRKLDYLEDRKVIERYADEDDRRRVRVALTSTGTETVRLYLEQIQQVL